MGEEKCRHPSIRLQKFVAFSILLILIATIVLVVLYFMMVKPKDPSLKVESITLQSLEIGNGAADFANITLLLWIWIRNPNRATFYFTDGEAYMYYYGVEVGFTPIPSGRLGSKSSGYLRVGLTVEAPYSVGEPFLKADLDAGLIHVGAATKLLGHVTALHIFRHHGSSTSLCSVNISVAIKNIIGYGCAYGVKI